MPSDDEIETVRCQGCGEQHPVLLRVHGIPLIDCPQIPDHEWYIVRTGPRDV